MPNRRTALERKTPLKANPEKQRDWERRSRATALENGREGMRSTGLRRATSLQDHANSKPAPRSAPVRFQPKVPARTQKCARCGQRADGWHHWLPQQQIRVYVRGLRWDERGARNRLRALLRDPRNLVALCHSDHQAHELRSRPLLRSEVPDAAFAFAMELGQEWAERLVRMYPARSERGAA